MASTKEIEQPCEMRQHDCDANQRAWCSPFVGLHEAIRHALDNDVMISASIQRAGAGSEEADKISIEVTLAVRILRSTSEIFRIRYRIEEWKTLDSSGSRFSCGEIRKVDVKHSVMSSINVDAEVAVPIKAR